MKPKYTPKQCPYGNYVCPYCAVRVDSDTRVCRRCRENHGMECGLEYEMICDECYDEEEAKLQSH